MPNVMRAMVTTKPRTMTFREVPFPEPSAQQALVRVESVGLCGSDYHLYTGDHPYVTYPQIQGHEFCGIVEQLPIGYAGMITVGDRVAVEPLISCGTCFPCRNGHYNCCTTLQVLGAHTSGALAEHIAVHADSLHEVRTLDRETAALVEPVSIGLQAVYRAGVRSGDYVAVFGAGPIGMAATLACMDRGARVMAIDTLMSRVELAQRMGAERGVVSGDDTLEQIREWTGGDGPRVVIDATGVPAVIRSAVEVVASSGTIVIVGLSHREVAIPVVEFTRKELNVLGSRNNAHVFAEAVSLVEKYQTLARSLVTQRYPLDKTGDAILFALEHPDQVEKIIIQVGGMPS